LDIDPRLTELLKSAGDEGTVEAVLMFNEPAKGASATEAVDVEKLMQSLTESENFDYNCFPNLRSVAVRATGRLVKRLLAHPQLKVATLNRE
jgi:hypothetical protein